MTILGELRRYSSSWEPTAPVLAGAFALNNCCEEPCLLHGKQKLSPRKNYPDAVNSHLYGTLAG